MLSLSIHVDCGAHKKLVCGEELSLDVPADASVLEFTPGDHTDKPVVLWSRKKRVDEKDARGTVTSSGWSAQRITKADQGLYTFLRENGGYISSIVVTVEGKKKTCRACGTDNNDNGRGWSYLTLFLCNVYCKMGVILL